ncbi:hypothetical protein EJ05DRAFT_297831 [Pseudovirgaria hyperparasitica]|uniref:BZIP domain-containing protein n=1 Tax=Pseudovirgaria hyperparasitica TaxID=470096 RepID=A0A6A6VTB0_9PEZI|nr:uncharacterized protein EJ05DRAFT_297831 [Pseudovirgaria hyperparasitica]KAF2752511.1 hypothetical protein EJ05DRAFT_297831 [Pseudovirgaria hyperparasitica]
MLSQFSEISMAERSIRNSGSSRSDLMSLKAILVHEPSSTISSGREVDIASPVPAHHPISSERTTILASFKHRELPNAQCERDRPVPNPPATLPGQANYERTESLGRTELDSQTSGSSFSQKTDDNSVYSFQDDLSYPVVTSNPGHLQAPIASAGAAVGLLPFPDANHRTKSRTSSNIQLQDRTDSGLAFGGDYEHYTRLDKYGRAYQIPVEIKSGSKQADDRRKRNAGASARFRQRRKAREKELASKLDAASKEVEAARATIEDLKCRLDQALEDKEFCRQKSATLEIREVTRVTKDI